MVALDVDRLEPPGHFLDRIGPALVERLLAGARRVDEPKGRMVFLEGDEPDAAYVVRSGFVRIFVSELDGSETTVRVAGPGEVFGELAIIDGGSRSATAATLRPTSMYRIPVDRFEAELPPPGTVARELLCSIVASLRLDTRRIAASRAYDVEHVVAAFVVEHPHLLHRLTQGELAGLIGVGRQSLNQVLRRWERTGLVTRRRGGLRLDDPDTFARRIDVSPSQSRAPRQSLLRTDEPTGR